MGPLGGADKATPGNNNGYNAYVNFNFLKLGMRKAGFTGKADTNKLIEALESIESAPQSADFPGGPMLMSKTDHQGRMTVYLMRIKGQSEEIIQTFAPEQMPAIGTCKVA